mgnify:CR=1 FL=1
MNIALIGDAHKGLYKCKFCFNAAKFEYEISICEEGLLSTHLSFHESPGCCEQCGDNSDEYKYHQDLFVCGDNSDEYKYHQDLFVCSEDCLNCLILAHGNNLFNYVYDF